MLVGETPHTIRLVGGSEEGPHNRPPHHLIFRSRTRNSPIRVLNHHMQKSLSTGPLTSCIHNPYSFIQIPHMIRHVKDPRRDNPCPPRHHFISRSRTRNSPNRKGLIPLSGVYRRHKNELARRTSLLPMPPIMQSCNNRGNETRLPQLQNQPPPLNTPT